MSGYGFNERDLKRIGKSVRKSETVASVGGSLPQGGSYLPVIFAKLTAKDGGSPQKFSWQQVYRQSDDTWAAGLLVGSTSDNPAYEINDVDFEINSVVVLERLPIRNTADGTVSLAWVFQAGGGGETGCEYQYQGRFAVAANVMGCDFPRAHPVIP